MRRVDKDVGDPKSGDHGVTSEASGISSNL